MEFVRVAIHVEQTNGRELRVFETDNIRPLLLGQSVNAAHQDALDLNNFLEVQFQLLDKSLEQLRMLSIGGIWRGCTVGDFLRTTLTRYARAAVVDETLKVVGVDMVPPSNQAIRDHVIIPHGTKLMEVPDYVQQQCGGIYSTGLGSYLRDRYWYLYPALDVARIDQAEDIATIIVVPPKRFPGVERTYRQDPGNLVIIASGDVKFQTDSTAQQLNHGNGIRYADASKVMDGFAQECTDRFKTGVKCGALVRVDVGLPGQVLCTASRIARFLDDQYLAPVSGVTGARLDVAHALNDAFHRHRVGGEQHGKRV